MINYVIGKEEVKRRVERLEIGDRVDLDHQLVVLIRGKRRRMKKLEKSKEKEEREKTWDWSEEGKKSLGSRQRIWR